MIRRRLRRGAVAALMLSGVALAPGAAVAADPVDVSISDVRAVDGRVSGVLTLRSVSQAQVDPGSVEGTLGGVSVPVAVSQEPPVNRAAMLVIDTSGSMGLEGMATVRAAVRDYLKQVPGDVKVGVTSFANTAGVDLAPTTNRKAAQRVVDGLASRGDTSLYQGMVSAVEGLGKVGDRSIVLLSDGADTVAAEPSAALNKATSALLREGVRVDVVRFRTDDPEATSALKAFASSNGGVMVAADDPAAVSDAFQASATALDSQVQFVMDVPATLSGAQPFTLTGRAGETSFEFRRSVAVGAVAPVVEEPAFADAGETGLALPRIEAADEPWLIWAAAGLMALALFGVVFALTQPSLHSKRERRIASVAVYAGAEQFQKQPAKAQQAAITGHMVAAGDRFMQDRKSTKTTLALIDRADLSFRAGEWLLIRLVSALVAAALMMLLAGGAQFLVFVALCSATAAAGFLLPQLVLRFLAAHRAKKFERVLPDVLTLVATSLRSGFGLPQALDAVARDAAEPAAKEFSRALAETRIGTDVPDALDHMAERMDSTSLRWAVMAIRIQREVGGNLADTLRTTAATLRERESLHRMVKSLSAEGRLSAYILIALPIGLFLYLFASNREYIQVLWTDPLGLIMLAFGVVLLVVGIFWMRKVVRIEV